MTYHCSGENTMFSWGNDVFTIMLRLIMFGATGLNLWFLAYCTRSILLLLRNLVVVLNGPEDVCVESFRIVRLMKILIVLLCLPRLIKASWRPLINYVRNGDNTCDWSYLQDVAQHNFNLKMWLIPRKPLYIFQLSDWSTGQDKNTLSLNNATVVEHVVLSKYNEQKACDVLCLIYRGNLVTLQDQDLTHLNSACTHYAIIRFDWPMIYLNALRLRC